AAVVALDRPGAQIRHLHSVDGAGLGELALQPCDLLLGRLVGWRLVVEFEGRARLVLLKPLLDGSDGVGNVLSQPGHLAPGLVPLRSVGTGTYDPLDGQFQSVAVEAAADGP